MILEARDFSHERFTQVPGVICMVKAVEMTALAVMVEKRKKTLMVVAIKIKGCGSALKHLLSSWSLKQKTAGRLPQKSVSVLERRYRQ